MSSCTFPRALILSASRTPQRFERSPGITSCGPHPKAGSVQTQLFELLNTWGDESADRESAGVEGVKLPRGKELLYSVHQRSRTR